MHLRIIALILLFKASLSAQLREFNVSEMPRPDVAVVQANTQFADDALILIYSNIEGLQFRSSLDKLDKQTYNAGASRYELLVKPVKQMLFVAKPDYIEAKISTLNPNAKDVYYFKVEEKTPYIADAAPGQLSISSEPAAAEIFLNGFKVADKTPFTFELNSGSTKIKLRKKKFEDLDTVVVIQSNQNSSINVRLKSSYLYLNITSNPSGAQVFLDDDLLGLTPLNHETDLSDKSKRGVKNLRLLLQGHEEIIKAIDYVPSGSALELNFDLKKRITPFTIKSNPSAAEVYIDGIYKGLTPYSSSKEWGTYDVSIKLEGYMPAVKQPLILNEGAAPTLSFSLEPIRLQEEEEVAFSGDGITIGAQVWMSKNVNTDRFQNGNLIPEAQTAAIWRRAGESQQPAWCYYDNDINNGEKFGKLYNWYAISDPRGLCPVGWHVPSDAEWTALTDFLEGTATAGGKLKAKSHWDAPNTAASNQSKFSGFPGGSRNSNGDFDFIGMHGNWWSSTPAQTNAWFRNLNHFYSLVDKAYAPKKFGFSVRCIKNKTD